MKYPIILITLFLTGLAVLNAQQSDYSLLLKNKTFVPEKNLQVITDETPTNEAINGKVFRIVQFNATPDEAQRQQIARAGIILTDYLPKYAYFAAVPANISPSVLASLDVRAVLPVTVEMKMDELIAQQPYPDWAINEPGTIDLVFSIYSNLPLPQQIEGLEQFNIKVLKINNYTNTITARIPVNKLKQMTALPFVQYVEAIMPPPMPENYVARQMHRSSTIDNFIPGGRKYDGTGVTVALLDDGEIGPHIDYKGRIVHQYNKRDNGDHGDHVAGTIMGAGNLNPKHKGMAPGAFLYNYDAAPSYQGFDSIYTHYASKNIRITSTSYSNGCNAGYTSFARELDIQSNMFPSLLHVFSAGNDGTSNCNYGAGSSWGNITGGHKVGKNVIAVGNLTDTDVIANSSSRGPAKDGRIKPEVCAKGTNVISTIDGNRYGSKTGTSMSAPGVSGSLAQLYHAYKENNNGQDPAGALMKAIMMNTADDLGNPGPDFIYGYGKINNFKAVKAIENQLYIQDVITHGSTKDHIISIPAGTRLAKIMLYWSDKEGAVNASPALVNDLDIELKDAGNNVHKPWVLDHRPNATFLNNVAVVGRDSINNAEQITISDPAAGNYTVSVTGHNVPVGPQQYYIVYYFEDDKITLTYPFGGEPWRNGEAERIQWDAYGNSGTFSVEFTVDNGTTWYTINSSVPGHLRSVNWGLPPLYTGRATIRVSRGAESDTTDMPVSIINTPSGFQYTHIGQDSLYITWQAVNGATDYDVFVLGQKYMDSVGTTSTNSFILTGIDLNYDNWVAVRARGANNTVGRRSIAEKINPQNDIGLVRIVSPDNGGFPSCLDNTVKVRALLQNISIGDISNVTMYYQFNNQPVVAENLSSTIKRDSTFVFTFSNPITLNTSGVNNLKVWVENTGDIYNDNDTATVSVAVVNRGISTSLNENFETMGTCSTASNCGSTTCNLSNNWYNESNISTDNVDWRVNSGSTPSANTGPSSDFNPGSSTGQYVYIEASDCFMQTAKMTTGCIDLSAYIAPELDFAYFMNGADMGELSVDIYAFGAWNEDVFKLSGPQGGIWQKAVVPLSSYKGEKILIRFRGTTGEGYRSDMALDDINIKNGLTASFVVADTVCVGEPVIFTDNSNGSDLAYNWNFGASASPTSAFTGGPHTITYSTTGIKTIRLIVATNNYTDTVERSIIVVNKADAAFTYTVDQQTVDLISTSLYTNNGYWLLGNGDSIPGDSISYTYNVPGTYNISFIATNNCSVDTFTQTVEIYGTGIDAKDHLGLKVYPNPGAGLFYLEMNAGTAVTAEVVNISGKKVKVIHWNGNGTYQLDMQKLPKGVYFLRIRSEKGLAVEKLVIE